MKTTRSLTAHCFKVFFAAVFVALMAHTVAAASASSGKLSLRDFDDHSNSWKNDRDDDDDDWRLDKPGHKKLKLKDCDHWDDRDHQDWDCDLRPLLDLLDRYNNHHGHDADALRKQLLQLIAYLLKHGHHHHCPPVSP